MVRGIQQSQGNEYYKDNPERKEGLTPEQEELLKRYEALDHKKENIQEDFEEESYDKIFDKVYDKENSSLQLEQENKDSQQEKLQELFEKIGKIIPKKHILRMLKIRPGSQEEDLDEIAIVMKEIYASSQAVENYTVNTIPGGDWWLT